MFSALRAAGMVDGVKQTVKRRGSANLRDLVQVLFVVIEAAETCTSWYCDVEHN